MKSTALRSNRAPHLGERTFPRLMLAPTLVVMAVLTAYPLIFTFFYSFTNYFSSYHFIFFKEEF